MDTSSAPLTEKRVWLLHCVVGMSPRLVCDLTGWERADVDRCFDGFGMTRWVTREGLVCVVSREFGETLGSSTILGLDRFIEKQRQRLLELFQRTDTVPWDRLDALHVEEIGRLLIHATLRTSLDKQLEALRRSERWGSTRETQTSGNAFGHI
jgi:hypothetical protein